MNILEAIRNRRSIGQVTDEPVSRQLIEQMIEAGCWAPTHHRTEPWRFAVFMDEGRGVLQHAMEAGTRTLHGKDSEAELTLKLAKVQDKAFRAPVVIAVWAAVGRGEKKNPPAWEDHAAVAACVQNMCLAAHGLGLATFWRTGDVGDMPEVQALCRAGADVFTPARGDKVVGFLYIGKTSPATLPPLRPVPKWEGKVSWVD